VVSEEDQWVCLSPEPLPQFSFVEKYFEMDNLKLNRKEEWYTPEDLIIKVREVIGDIDLDPASTKQANEIIKARRFYSLEDDGLTKHWSGVVYCNPPYNKNIGKFGLKLLDHYEANEVDRAILLVKSQGTDTRWFQRMLEVCTTCFVKGRIRFWTIEGEGNFNPTFGSVFFYMGEDKQIFESHFQDIGVVVSKL
jgi:hypothetical protein